MANQLDPHWVEMTFATWAKALTGRTVTVRLVDTLPTGVYGSYKAAHGLDGERIELRRGLLSNPDELTVSFFHELAHSLGAMPAYRRKSYHDAEIEAERFGWRSTDTMRRTARKHGKDLSDLLTMPEW